MEDHPSRLRLSIDCILQTRHTPLVPSGARREAAPTRPASAFSGQAPMPRVCAYCGSGNRLTREHLFPRFLDRLMPTYDVNLSSSRPGKVTGAMTIRDVCQRCNNERLATLDEYGRSFCMKNVRRFVAPGGVGSLTYEFHRLARWFWKVHYNTVRADSDKAGSYRTLIPYILGDDEDAPQPQTLMAGVIKAYKTTPAERARHKWPIMFPRAVRAADVKLGEYEYLAHVYRSLSLNSYIFWSILWRKGIARAERRRATAGLSRALDMKVLRAPGGKVSMGESSFAGFEVRAYFSIGRAMRAVEPTDLTP